MKKLRPMGENLVSSVEAYGCYCTYAGCICGYGCNCDFYCMEDSLDNNATSFAALRIESGYSQGGRNLENNANILMTV